MGRRLQRHARRLWATTTSASALLATRRRLLTSHMQHRICRRSCVIDARRQHIRRARRRQHPRHHPHQHRLLRLPISRRQHHRCHLLPRRLPHPPRITAMLARTTAGGTRSPAKRMRHARRLWVTTTSASVLLATRRRLLTSRMQHRSCRRSCVTGAKRQHTRRARRRQHPQRHPHQHRLPRLLMRRR